MTRASLARTSSLARSSRDFEPAGMSLDQYYLALGKAAKADFQAGLITQGAYLNRIATLQAEYKSLKGGN